MEKEKIDWQKYRKDLIGSLSNERIWALGHTGGYNPHLDNISRYEIELEFLDEEDYDTILEMYSDTPDYFNDFLL